jgi:hypothetical protein
MCRAEPDAPCFHSRKPVVFEMRSGVSKWHDRKHVQNLHLEPIFCSEIETKTNSPLLSYPLLSSPLLSSPLLSSPLLSSPSSLSLLQRARISLSSSRSRKAIIVIVLQSSTGPKRKGGKRYIMIASMSKSSPNLDTSLQSHDSPTGLRVSIGSAPPIERLSIPAALTESSDGKSHTVYVIEVHSNGSCWQVRACAASLVSLLKSSRDAGQAPLSGV